MHSKTEIMHVLLDTTRDDDSVDVKVTLRRHPAMISYAGSPPDVNDLPEDFRQALLEWLGADADLVSKIESITPWAVPASYVGKSHNGPEPVLIYDEVKKVMPR